MFKLVSILCLFAVVFCDPCQWSSRQLSTFKSCVGSSMVEIDQCLGKFKNEGDWSKIQKEICKSNDSKEKAMKCIQKSKSSSNFQTCWSKAEAMTNGSPVGGHSPISSSTQRYQRVTSYSSYGQQGTGYGQQGTGYGQQGTGYGTTNGYGNTNGYGSGYGTSTGYGTATSPGYGTSFYSATPNGSNGYGNQDGSSGYRNQYGSGTGGYGSSGYGNQYGSGTSGYGSNVQNGQGYGQTGYSNGNQYGTGQQGPTGISAGISAGRNPTGTFYG